MIYVLDACALISFLIDEPGCEIIEKMLKKTADGENKIYMHIVNLIEVHYANVSCLGSEQAGFLLEKILASPIQIVSVISDTIFHRSSLLKASYKCSLADCIGLATAIELSGQFVTSDHHELETVEKNEAIGFVWLPPHPKK